MHRAGSLHGQKSSMVRINERGEVIVSVAVPVRSEEHTSELQSL